MFKFKWYFSLAIVLALLLGACQPQAAAPSVVLRIGYMGKPDTLNPAYAFLEESYYMFDLVYSTLTKENAEGVYVGDLASEWSHSDDGLVWTFKLKDGIKWHDGTAFTADDIAWSIDAIMKDPDAWTAVSSYAVGFKEVKAIDPKTLQITLENPVGNMEYRLSYLFAMPRTVFEQFKDATELQNFSNFEIMGTGPFKMKTFDKDKGILILDANPDYFGGKPNIDQVVWQTFDNADAMVQALKVGDIDVCTEVPNTAAETVKAYENVKVVQEPGRGMSELIINSVPETNDPAPSRNPAVTDPQVRLALAHAINKPDLVDIVLQGMGTTGVSIIPRTLGGGFWFNSDIKDVTFDLAQANQILEEAGYVKGSDGVRAKGNVRLEFRFQYPSDSETAPRVADLMAGWFKEIGVSVSPQSTDPDSLTAAITPAGDFDLALWGWTSDPDPDFMLSAMTSEQFVEGGWSDSGYSNPEYDALYMEQQKTVDRNERQKIVWKMQEMVFNDRPYIVYWYDDFLQAYRTDRFTGFVESPSVRLNHMMSLMQVKPISK